MFTHAAQSLGFRVCVLDPDGDSPAGRVAEQHLAADYLNAAALAQLREQCVAITTEFENVPARALETLAATRFVSPAAACVAVAQDRVAEKRFVARAGILVAPHAVIEQESDLDDVPRALFPGILKSARLGYDGKGQARVLDAAAARAAWPRMGAVTCVLEQQLRLVAEVSVVVCRTHDGALRTYPVAENTHRDGILAVSVVPARIAAPLAEQARALAERIAQALEYVGVLCVEFFVVEQDGRAALVVNEMAPRPHNSGHWTLDAAVTSQFEQQARVLARLPLGSTEQVQPAVMLNLLGDLWFAHGAGAPTEPPWAEVLADDCARLHLYGKREPRLGRKMGHLTLVAPSLETALARAQRAAQVLGLPAPQ
jgi:5-(carboxyamino)imidazole ribonucleotide synthase